MGTKHIEVVELSHGSIVLFRGKGMVVRGAGTLAGRYFDGVLPDTQVEVHVNLPPQSIRLTLDLNQVRELITALSETVNATPVIAERYANHDDFMAHSQVGQEGQGES